MPAVAGETGVVGRRWILRLPPDVEAEALAELDAWCDANKLQLASARRAEALAERSRDARRLGRLRRKTVQHLTAVLDVYRSSLNARDYPAERPDGRPKFRPRGRSAVKRLAWACEHHDRPNSSHGRCKACAKRDARRAAGIPERRQGVDLEQQRERQRAYMRAKRAAERARQAS